MKKRTPCDSLGTLAALLGILCGCGNGAPTATDHGSGGAAGDGAAGAPSGGGRPQGGSPPAVGGSSSGGAGRGAESGAGNIPGGGAAGAESGQAGQGTGGVAGGSGGSGGSAGSGGTGGASETGWPTPVTGSPYSGPTTSITVTVMRNSPVGRLVPGFAGFSFEKTHLTDGFFAGSNAPLIALFRLLGPGFLRIGANDVNRAQWQASAQPVAGGTTSKNVGTADVDGLAAFLKATDWKAMYGLNISPAGGPADGVAEAKYAASALGDKLYTFEMGNEPADYAAFKSQWETLQAAIHAAVPAAEFNGPESNTTSTTTQFASDEASRIVLITHHHYVGGAGTANATMAYLLSGDTGTISRTKTFVDAATANHLRDGFRWGEDNSFFHHGQPGVSDAFGSALWGIEHMFKAAETGAVGVNFHGGGQNMDGNSCPTGPTSCSLPFVYSPIDEVNSQVTAAAPLYYGMLFVSRAGTGTLLSTGVSSGSLNVFAHTLELADGSTNVVIVNNDASQGLRARVDLGVAVASASAVYLQAPSLGATSGVTFAGDGVSPAGAWTPKSRFALPVSGNAVTVVVPPASAALILAH